MVFLFNKTVKNILSNCNPHETVTFDDRNLPSTISNISQEKNNTYRSYILNDKNPQIFHKVKYLQNQLKNLIEHNLEKYYLRVSKKLIDPMTSPRTYWSILKTLLINKNIPCIPPFLQNK